MANIMNPSASKWLSLLFAISFLGSGLCACHLDNYIASCILDLLEEHIEATAIINHCHLPLDVTFLVTFQYGNRSKHNWKYTFVTANQNERVLIPGLLLPPAPHAPVFLYARVPQKDFDMHNSSFVAIEASFVAELKRDEWEEAEFLNHTIYIDTTDDCRFMKVGKDPIPWIVGGLFLITILFGMIGGGCYLYRKKKLAVDQLALVTSMEVGLPGAQPYQVEADSNKTDQQKANMSFNDLKASDNGVESNENNPNTPNGTVETQDNNKVTVNSNGFNFGRLKEDKESVIIGNPAFEEDDVVIPSVPSRKIKKRKSSRRQLYSTNPQEINGHPKEDVSPESSLEHQSQHSSLECEGNENKTSIKQQSDVLQHPLEDSSSDDGMPVGQGARRKVRGVLSTVAGTPSVISPEIQDSNDASQKGL